MKLKLAPDDNNAPYIAVYHAANDLANGVATVCGGVILEWLYVGGDAALQLYAQLFLLGWIGRTLVAGLFAWLKEPGAQRLQDIVGAE